MYLKLVLKPDKSPARALIRAFRTLYIMLSGDDFESVILPLWLSKRRRTAEHTLEELRAVLEGCRLDLSQVSLDILSHILPDICNPKSGGRVAALHIVKCLTKKSSDKKVVDKMINTVTSKIREGGGEKFGHGHGLSDRMIGLLNALEEISKCSGSVTLPPFEVILTCYKNTGNENVKIACLTALCSWLPSSINETEIIKTEILPFTIAGLEEKQLEIRRAHLRCLRCISLNADAVSLISRLRKFLIRLVKSSCAKAEQQLDGVYALVILGKIAATDAKTAEMMNEGTLTQLVLRNQHSVAMISKLSIEDGMTYLELLDLVRSLWMVHPARDTEAFDCKVLMQVVLAVLCHQSCVIRKAAYLCAKKILSLESNLVLIVLDQFSAHIRQVLPESRNHSLGTRVAYSPSIEVLVNALLVISSGVSAAAPDSFTRLVYFSHLSYFLAGTKREDRIWKRVRKCLEARGFDVNQHIMTNVGNVCKWFHKQKGSMNATEKEGALNSLVTLKGMMPAESSQCRRFDQIIHALNHSYQHGSSLPSQNSLLDIVNGDMSQMIFPRLSLKELIRMCILSKDWRFFIWSYMKRITGRKVLFAGEPHHFDPFSISVLSKSPIPPFNRQDNLYICGEIDGAVAMADWDLSRLFLYNPLTGKCLHFPRSTFGDPDYDIIDARYCFGLGSGKLNPKLIILDCGRFFKNAFSQVFDFGSGTWSKLKCKKSYCAIMQQCGTYLRTTRSVYWMACRTQKASFTSDYFVLSIDMKSLAFSELEIGEIGTGVPFPTLGLLNGHLCSVISSIDERPSYDVRILDGETWSTLYHLETPFGFDIFEELSLYGSFPTSDNAVYEVLHLAAILQEEKLLVVGNKKDSPNSVLILYDLRTKTQKELSTEFKFYGSIRAIEYKECVEGLAALPPWPSVTTHATQDNISDDASSTSSTSSGSNFSLDSDSPRRSRSEDDSEEMWAEIFRV